MRLIEMVQKARESGYRYIAVDGNKKSYCYKHKPFALEKIIQWNISKGNIMGLGYYNLTCNWKDSLIDVTKLRGIK